MRKLAVLAAMASLLVGMAVLPASAEQAGGNATFNVGVPVAITFEWAQGDVTNFGQVAPGASAEKDNYLAYNISSNNASGFTVDVTTANTPSPIQWFIRHAPDTGAYTSLVPGATLTGWNTETGPVEGKQYLNDVKVSVPSGTSSGVYSQVVSFVATTNP